MKTIFDQKYQVRAATMDDVQAATEMMNAWGSWVLGIEKFSATEIEREWLTPGFNPGTDICLVIAPDGNIVGYEELWDLNKPHTRIMCWGRVHPDHAGQGIGTYLLDWAEQRARLALLKAPAEARVALLVGALSIDRPSLALFEGAGLRVVRHYLRMVIDMNGNLSKPATPPGIHIRPMIVGSEEPVAIRTVHDSFKDHWGYQEQPFEEEYRRWRHFMENSDVFDPTLWFLAMDGDRVAGVSLCYLHAFDDPEMGWVGSLGVRREYRGGGVALALLQYSFNEFARRGMRRVGLGVDAQSLTGATRLYLKAGMQPDLDRQTSLYEKELRPGLEMSTQSV